MGEWAVSHLRPEDQRLWLIQHQVVIRRGAPIGGDLRPVEGLAVAVGGCREDTDPSEAERGGCDRRPAAKSDDPFVLVDDDRLALVVMACVGIEGRELVSCSAS